ncbi:HSF-type DNA-binding-domain-containing protein [Mycena galericulata]|nr:HSF-type DNA-binding-domain-containing protein [Mycena galericulata]
MNEQHDLVDGAQSPTEPQGWDPNTHDLKTTYDGAFPEHPAGGSNTGRMASATAFIKKLYKLLSDESVQNVIAWAPQRDRFVVKDIDEFRTSILPRLFKHSNFASFIRQLNKYGFRKVKNIEDEDSWTFQHPDFHANRRHALDNIRRRVSVPRKSSLSEPMTSGSSESSQNAVVEFLQTEVASMQTQLTSLGNMVSETVSHAEILQHSHQKILVEIVALQQGIAQQNRLLASLVNQDLRTIHGDNAGRDSLDPHATAFLLRKTQELPQVATSASRLDRSVGAGARNAAVSQRHILARTTELQAQHRALYGAMNPEREQMVSQQRVVQEMPDWEKYDEPMVCLDMSPASSPGGWSAGSESSSRRSFDGSIASSFRGGSGALPQVQRMMFIPKWTVPPHVLVVEDDDVSRKLSAKFLQVFGCTTDLATDGVEAVNKMTEAKYDLVFMDIILPKLDGVSATSMIRTFDQQTPIISMTSHVAPTELLSYSSSGMNGTWPKPFEKEVLLDILERHLTHLTLTHNTSSSSSSSSKSSMSLSPSTTGSAFSDVEFSESALQVGVGGVASPARAGVLDSGFGLNPDARGWSVRGNPLAELGLAAGDQYVGTPSSPSNTTLSMDGI